MPKKPAKCVLFICTGNYYRSRFAELLFNHLMDGQHSAMAFSRGIEAFKKRNEDAISPFALDYLKAAQIPLMADFAFPAQLDHADMKASDTIIAMDATEHQPLMQRYFPAWRDKIQYWDFPDIDFQTPEVILPKIEEAVKNLVKSLKKAEKTG